MVFADIVQAFMKGGVFPDPKMNCIFLCIMDEQKLLTEKGAMDMIRMVDLLDTMPTKTQNILMTAAAKCPVNLKQKNACERWYKVHECLRTKDPDYYFF